MARPTPPGRSLDPGSEDRARGMVVIRRRPQGRRWKQNSAYGSLRSFHTMKQTLFLFLLAAAAVAAQQPGQIRPRPGQGRGPEWPPPSIVDYKPKSTLVTAEHLKPRAKFPVIDIHSHQPVPIGGDRFAQVVQGMDPNNLKLLVNLSGGSGDSLRRGVEAIAASPFKDRMALFANVNFRNVGPGFGARAAAQLEADIKAGALGLKVFKDLGMFDRKA